MSSYLPEEIIFNILLRLQVKTLFIFRCVCKSWCNLITNYDFVRMHLNHSLEMNNNCSLMIDSGNLYSVDSVSSSSLELCYEAVKIDIPFKYRFSVETWGSCNGLLCGTSNYVKGNNLFIWNPFTKEYKKISPPPNTSRNNYIGYGFGYDYKIDDYKLVRIASSHSVDDVNVEVNVCTLGSNSWRTIQSFPRKPFVPNRNSGVLLDGALLHWIDLDRMRSKVIVSFDIGDERFKEIELPNCLVGKFTPNVGVFRGDLCLLGHMSQSHDLWVMKDYGVIESWTKLFSIAREESTFYLKPIYSFKNSEILFEVRFYKKDDQNYGLVSYDANRERARTLKIRSFPQRSSDIHTYVGSLVSPNRVPFSK